MEVSMGKPTEINRVDFPYRKRKIQTEPVGVPRSKHVRWGQVVEDGPSDSTTEPTKMGGGRFERECVRNGIGSLQSNIDSTGNKDKTDPGCPNTQASDETSSSSSGCIAGRSMTEPTSSESETLVDHEADLPGYSDYSDYEELENLLLSSILSSRRWFGDQDVGKKLTIDEEFEEYFSMLML